MISSILDEQIPDFLLVVDKGHDSVDDVHDPLPMLNNDLWLDKESKVMALELAEDILFGRLSNGGGVVHVEVKDDDIHLEIEEKDAVSA